jgi:hypothetical protein
MEQDGANAEIDVICSVLETAKAGYVCILFSASNLVRCWRAKPGIVEGGWRKANLTPRFRQNW